MRYIERLQLSLDLGLVPQLGHVGVDSVVLILQGISQLHLLVDGEIARTGAQIVLGKVLLDFGARVASFLPYFIIYAYIINKYKTRR